MTDAPKMLPWTARDDRSLLSNLPPRNSGAPHGTPLNTSKPHPPHTYTHMSQTLLWRSPADCDLSLCLRNFLLKILYTIYYICTRTINTQHPFRKAGTTDSRSDSNNPFIQTSIDAIQRRRDATRPSHRSIDPREISYVCDVCLSTLVFFGYPELLSHQRTTSPRPEKGRRISRSARE